MACQIYAFRTANMIEKKYRRSVRKKTQDIRHDMHLSQRRRNKHI